MAADAAVYGCRCSCLWLPTQLSMAADAAVHGSSVHPRLADASIACDSFVIFWSCFSVGLFFSFIHAKLSQASPHSPDQPRSSFTCNWAGRCRRSFVRIALSVPCLRSPAAAAVGASWLARECWNGGGGRRNTQHDVSHAELQPAVPCRQLAGRHPCAGSR